MAQISDYFQFPKSEFISFNQDKRQTFWILAHRPEKIEQPNGEPKDGIRFLCFKDNEFKTWLTSSVGAIIQISNIENEKGEIGRDVIVNVHIEYTTIKNTEDKWEAKYIIKTQRVVPLVELMNHFPPETSVEIKSRIKEFQKQSM